MADPDMGDAGIDVRKSPRSPIGDDSRATGGSFAGRARPSIDEDTLHVPLGRRQLPVAGHSLHPEAGLRKTSGRGRRGVRPGGRTTEPLVCSLMTVEQIEHQGVLWLPGLAP